MTAPSIPSMKRVVVGTAGHIDHGKTELVRALTGVNADRFKEEQERGITIDIGFAPLELGPDLTIGFIDVPGHEKFVKNMLAGIWGIDLVLLVVSADESIKPQTREHFDICSLLRVKSGLIALTKTDLVDPELVELASMEVREFTRGSFLERAPIVPVSAKTGDGITALKEAIGSAAREVEPGRGSALLRLPVDRSFSMKGFGTVVTGTLVSGEVGEGDELMVYPAGRPCRVRGMQVHGLAVTRARAGQRIALNLSGIDATAVGRGDVVARPGQMAPSSLMDVRLRLLPSAPGPIKDLARVRFHQGTSELLARVKLLDVAGKLEPGQEALAQLRLEKPGLSLPSDRFVVRRYSPTVTIGGGVVLDAHASKHTGPMPAELARRLERLESADALGSIKVYLESEPAGSSLQALAVRAGRAPDEVMALMMGPAGPVATGEALRAGDGAGSMFVDHRAAEALEGRVLGFLEAYHRANPLRHGAPREELREQALGGVGPETVRLIMERLAGAGAIRAQRDTVGLSGHEVTLTPADERLLLEIEQAILKAGLNPPTLEEIARAAGDNLGRAEKLLALLLVSGRLVRIGDGKVFHAAALDELKQKLWSIRSDKSTIDIVSFKELTGTSRKNAIPLLEHLDSVKVTRRQGSEREILPPPGG